MLDVRRPTLPSASRRVGVPAPSPASGDPASRLIGAAPDSDLGAYLRELRLSGPMVRSRSGWVTARHDVASAALAHEGLTVEPVVAADAGRGVGAGGGLPPGVGPGSAGEVPWARPLGAALAAPEVTGLEVDVEGWVDGLMEEFPAGRVDLVEALAEPLAGMVAGELLGLPSAEWPSLQPWVEDLVPWVGARRETVGGSHAVRRYLHDHVVARRAEPGGAVLDALLREGSDGDGLTRHEAGGAAVALLIGGYVTTHAVVGASLAALLGTPQQVELLLARPGSWSGAVDEAMRVDPPVPVVVLRARDRTVVAGLEVSAGETLVVSVAGANRDPDAFPDPDAVDVVRRPVVAPIGPESTGPDRATAGFARRVAEAAVARLVQRHPNVRLAEAPERMWRAGLRDVRRLTVRPGGRA